MSAQIVNCCCFFFSCVFKETNKCFEWTFEWNILFAVKTFALMLESVLESFKAPFTRHPSVAAMLVTSHDVNFMMGFVKNDEKYAIPTTDNVSELNPLCFVFFSIYTYHIYRRVSSIGQMNAISETLDQRCSISKNQMELYWLWNRKWISKGFFMCRKWLRHRYDYFVISFGTYKYMSMTQRTATPLDTWYTHPRVL